MTNRRKLNMALNDANATRAQRELAHILMEVKDIETAMKCVERIKRWNAEDSRLELTQKEGNHGQTY